MNEQKFSNRCLFLKAKVKTKSNHEVLGLVHYVYMTSLIFDVIGRLYPEDHEWSKSFCCQQILLNQLHKIKKFRDMRGRHPSVSDVWKFKTDVSKETLRVGV